MYRHSVSGLLILELLRLFKQHKMRKGLQEEWRKVKKRGWLIGSGKGQSNV